MTRSAAHRASGVQVEKSLPPIPSNGGSGGAPATRPASSVPWYWRLALFLWATSFAFLLLYELLAGIIKAW
jgi:hypothetical protein